MRKPLKRIAFAFAAFFGVLIIAGFIIPPFMDWNKYRGQVEAIASNMLDEQVKVDGDVALRLLPSPEVTASTVRIVSATGDDDIATVNTLHIRIDTLALLTGKMAVSSLELTAPHMTVQESEGVGWHVQGFAPEEGETSSKNIRLSNVLVRDGAITLLPLGGSALTLNAFNIDFSGELPLGPMDGLGSFTINKVPVKFEARLLPMSDGKSQSLRFVATAEKNELEVTGRIMQEGRFNGRLKVKADTVSELSGIVASMQGAEQPTMFPAVPLFVDVRVDTAPGRIELESRRVQMGESEGRLNLMVTGQAKKRFLGSLTLGSIDMDLWKFSAGTEAANAPIPAINWPESLSGALDITVESLTWHGQQVRQVDVSMEMTQDRLLVEKAQALVPGGGELSLGGESLWSLKNPTFIGRVGMKSGRLRDFLTWAGMDISWVPEDKVMSIAYRSDLTASFNRWSVDNINAVIDDSHVTGKAGGALTSGLKALNIVVDSFNYDAYMTDDSTFQGAMALPASAAIKVDTLTLGGHQVKALDIQLNTTGTILDKLTVTAKAFGGNFALNTKVDNYRQWSGIDGSLSAVGMRLEDIRLGFESLAQANQVFAGPVTLQSSFNGRFSELNTKNSLKIGGDVITSEGRLRFTEPRLDTLSAVFMKGAAAFKSSEKLMVWLGFESNTAPSNFSFSGGGDLDGELLVEMSGDITGVKTALNGTWRSQEPLQKFRGNMLVAIPENVRKNTALSFLTGTGETRATAAVLLQEKTVTLTEIDLTHDKAKLTGDIEIGLGDNNTFGGRVTLTDFIFQDSSTGEPAKFDNGWRQTAFAPLPLRNYRGDVTVFLERVSGWGQVVNTGTGKLVSDNNGIGFSLSTATINNAPATANFRLNAGAGDSLSFSTDISMEKMLLEPLSARFFGPAVRGTIGAMTLNMTGNGRSEHALVKTLRGDGNFKASAGTLRFMDAPKLIRAINSAESRGAFVLALPQLLDNGYSDINSLDGAFTVERGVVTLAPLTAKGSWGILSLPGTLDISNRTLSLKGQVKLIDPIDLGALPISFEGPVTAPKAKYDTLALIRFADAAIGRRMRTKLAEEQKQALDDNGGTVEPAGKLFDLVKKILKDTKETEAKDDKEKPSAVPPPAEQTP